MRTEVKVDLDFTCSVCGANMGVTLKCAGVGLLNGLHTVAQVQVPCPTCQQYNQLYFEPSGTIHAIAPCPPQRGVPEPSVN